MSTQIETTINTKQPVTPDVAHELIAELCERGIKFDVQEHEKINYDEATQKYLPSDRTYTIQMHLASTTGTTTVRRVDSVEEIAAAIAAANTTTQ